MFKFVQKIIDFFTPICNKCGGKEFQYIIPGIEESKSCINCGKCYYAIED